MTENVVSVTPQDILPDIVRLMETRHVKRLPVIEDGRLVGIVSRANLVRALVRRLTQSKAGSGKGVFDDGEIRDRILAEIRKEPWGPRYSVDVAVNDGVVELHGSLTNDRERTALRVAAENVPGVKAVRDHLVWVEPLSGMVIPAEGSGPVDAA